MTFRSAEWIFQPVVEREWAADRRAAVVRRRLGWALLFFSACFCPLSYVVFMASFLLWTLAVGPVLSLVVGVAWWSRTVAEGGRREAWQRALGAEFESAEGWTVELAIYQGATPTGYDRGVVWFEDDGLYFLGRRTSFRLAPGSSYGLDERRPIEGLRSGLHLGLTGDLAVGFDVVAFGESRALVQEQLAWAIRRWRTRRGTGGGPNLPLSLGPDAPSARRLFVRATGAYGFWGLSAWAVVVASSNGRDGVAVAVVAVLLLAVCAPEVWAPWQRVQAWRDRRRLERGGFL